jgi:hypothetical protein
MTDNEHSILSKYIRDVADKLGLKDWEFELKREPPEDKDAGAEVSPAEGRKFAHILVASDFREYKPKTQANYILHELIHLHLQSACDVIRLDLWENRVLPQTTYDVLCGGFRRQIEYAVDGLATALAPMFPVIEWE